MTNIRRLGRTTDGRFYWLPWEQRIGGEPVILTPPAISGTAGPGQTVAAVPGTYTGTPTPVLRKREWTLYNVAGAIAGYGVGDTYPIPVGAPTGRIRLQETMVGVGSLSVVGEVEAPLIAVTGLPVFTSTPTITITTGTGAVGSILTRTNATATGSPAPTITGNWLRDGVAISGATGATYTTTAAGVHTFQNTASNSVSVAAGVTVTRASTGITITAIGNNAPVFTVAPTISYNSTSGKFTCTTGTVSGTPTPALTYLWHYADTATSTLNARDGGATSTPNEWIPAVGTYAGKYIACQVTATNSAGNAVSMTMRVLRPAQEGWTVDPTLTGSAPMGNILKVDDGTFYTGQTAKTYKWFRGTAELSTTTDERKTGEDDVDNTLTVQITLTYASGNTYTKSTNGIAVTAGTGGTVTYPAISGMAATTTAASILKWSADSGHYDFEATATGYKAKGSGVYNDNWCSALHIIGYEAWRGNTVAQGRLVEWINRWTQPTSCPGFAGGYSIQHGCDFMDNVAWGRRTPAVWNALSSTTKNRCEAMAKLALWTIGIWRETADSSQYKTRLGTQNSTTADGNSNPNIAGAPARLWYAAAWFMGGIDEALDYIENNTLDDLVATMAPVTTAKPGNLNLANPYAVWSKTYSSAPSNAQVQSRARSRQSRRGVALNDPLAQLCKEIDMACNKPAVRGLNDGAGVNDSDYLNGSSNAATVPKALRDRYSGHTKQGRMFLNPATVSKSRWDAIEDKIGAYQEFDTLDVKSGASGPRSSISYAFKCNPHVFGAVMLHIAAGFVSPSAKALQDRRDKLFVAKEFMWFCSTEACGYDGVAHIGTGDNGGNSDNVEPGSASDRQSFAITNVLSFNEAVMTILDAA